MNAYAFAEPSLLKLLRVSCQFGLVASFRLSPLSLDVRVASSKSMPLLFKCFGLLTRST